MRLPTGVLRGFLYEFFPAFVGSLVRFPRWMLSAATTPEKQARWRSVWDLSVYEEE